MIIAGKYQVIEELTKTTLSIVYVCEHIIKKERVIVKIEKQKNLLQKEAQMYLYLRTKKVHIPSMKGTGIHEDFAYLVLSPLKQSLLHFEGKISYLDFFKELYHLHEANVVHRDIKPHNILLASPNEYSSVADEPKMKLQKSCESLIVDDECSLDRLSNYILKISDMGLSKQLDHNEHSFSSLSFTLSMPTKPKSHGSGT